MSTHQRVDWTTIAIACPDRRAATRRSGSHRARYLLRTIPKLSWVYGWRDRVVTAAQFNTAVRDGMYAFEGGNGWHG